MKSNVCTSKHVCLRLFEKIKCGIRPLISETMCQVNKKEKMQN